ncbi:MAG: hypothetical protein KC583_12870 [Myxococcales bacterium]|nr:hypothetical protein [Myxococcales bacterium]
MTVVALATAAPVAHASAPRGAGGFTIGLGLGLGVQTLSPDDGDSESEFGLAGLNLRIGGFLSPNLAILFKVTGTVVNRDVTGGEATYTHAMGGPAVQYFFNDRLHLDLGAGVSALRAEAKVETPRGDFNISVDDNAFGVLGGLGYIVGQSGEHALLLSLELGAGLHDDGNAYSTGFVVNWQWL